MYSNKLTIAANDIFCLFVCLSVAEVMVGECSFPFVQKELCTMIGKHNDECYPREFIVKIKCEGRERPVNFKFYPYSCQKTPLKYMSVKATINSENIPKFYQIEAKITVQDKQGSPIGNVVYIPCTNSRNNPLKVLSHEDIFYETESDVIQLNVEVFLLLVLSVSCKATGEYMMVDLKDPPLTDREILLAAENEEASSLSLEPTDRDSSATNMKESSSAASSKASTAKIHMKPEIVGMTKLQYRNNPTPWS